MDRSSYIERNFQAFQSKLPQLLPEHLGKFALLQNGEIVDFFDSFADAVKFGQQKFSGDQVFSVQEVTSTTQTLGYYAYAVGNIHQ